MQAVAGVDHFFTSRRLQLRAEAYYKRFSNLISYGVENVRVVYSAENDSEGYAFGGDLQLRGELVPGLESWVTYGFLRTGERFYAPTVPDGPEGERVAARYAARGAGATIPRPTDRRHNLSLFVQDYVPGDDTWTLHIRTLYGTGVPTTPPARDPNNSLDAVSAFIDGPRNSLRLPSYFRFDLGATKELRVGTAPTGAPLLLRATVEVDAAPRCVRSGRSPRNCWRCGTGWSNAGCHWLRWSRPGSIGNRSTTCSRTPCSAGWSTRATCAMCLDARPTSLTLSGLLNSLSTD